jgi:hypothetical protein
MPRPRPPRNLRLSAKLPLPLLLPLPAAPPRCAFDRAAPRTSPPLGPQPNEGAEGRRLRFFHALLLMKKTRDFAKWPGAIGRFVLAIALANRVFWCGVCFVRRWFAWFYGAVVRSSQVKLILSPKQRAKPAASRTRTCTNAAVCIASGECPYGPYGLRCRTVVFYGVVRCRTLSYFVVLCRTLPYGVVLCRTVSYFHVLCRTVSYGALSVRRSVCRTVFVRSRNRTRRTVRPPLITDNFIP